VANVRRRCEVVDTSVVLCECSDVEEGDGRILETTRDCNNDGYGPGNLQTIEGRRGRVVKMDCMCCSVAILKCGWALSSFKAFSSEEVDF
jgi:hypothetical protein